MKKICFTCNKEFIRSRKKQVKTFCSQTCYWQSLRGQPSKRRGQHQVAWNKGCKSKFPAWNKGTSYHALEKHSLWKGDAVGYTALHKWVRKQGGIPNFCSKGIAHQAKIFVWANKSGLYKRDLSDWHTLCNSCNLTDNIPINERFKYA